MNGLFERLRQQTGQSAAPNPKTGSPSNMPPLQQYPRPTERASSTYTNDPSFFPQYQYGQLPTKSQTPPTYNPPIPTVSSSQTDPNKAASLLGILRFTQAAPAGPQGSTMPIPREAILSPPPLQLLDQKSLLERVLPLPPFSIPKIWFSNCSIRVSRHKAIRCRRPPLKVQAPRNRTLRKLFHPNLIFREEWRLQTLLNLK